MVDSTNFLDFYDVFVNEVAGSPIIFIFLALALLMFFAAMAKLPDKVTLMLGALFLIIMSVFIGGLLPWVLLFILVFVGWNLVRLMSRG